MSPALQLWLRLTLLGLVFVIVQIAGVSQVSLLGVSADLSPLVVASVGLLCGSIVGAIFESHRSSCREMRERCFRR